MAVKMGVCSLFFALAAMSLTVAVPAQPQGTAAPAVANAEEGSPYPRCQDASEFGYAALMSRYQDNVPLSQLIEENHRRHDPEVAAVMDRVATRAYKVRSVPASDAARVAGVFRDTLYLSCVERVQQAQRRR